MINSSLLASSYLRSFPAYLQAIDLHSLVSESSSSPWNLMDLTPTKATLEFSFQGSDDLLPTLSHFLTEYRKNLKNTGLSKLAIGYPLVYLQKEEDWLLAPLFLWSVRLQWGPQPNDTWTIHRQSYDPVQINPVIEQNPDAFFLDPLSTEELSEMQAFKLDYHVFPSLSQHLFQRFSGDDFIPFENLSPIPALSDLSEIQDLYKIYSAAILGHFPGLGHFQQQQSPSYWQDVPFDQSNEPQFPFALPVGGPETSAIREKGRRYAFHEVQINQGADWPNTIAHLLTNNALSGQRTLLVSDRQAALEQVQQVLQRHSLQSLNYLLKGAEIDQLSLLQLIRAAIQQPFLVSKQVGAAYALQLQQTKRKDQELEQSYQAWRTPIFGTLTWSQVVGKYLANQQLAGKELLGSQLSAATFDWNENEYLELLNILADSYPLYQKINTLAHPLRELHPDLFLAHQEADSLEQVLALLNEHQDRYKSLQMDFLQLGDQYAIQLGEHFEKYYLQLHSRLKHLLGAAADLETAFKVAASDVSIGTLRMKGIFSSQARKMKEQLEGIQMVYHNLVDLFKEKSYFTFQFLPNVDSANLEQIRTNLHNFQQQLQEWKQSWTEIIDQEVDRLSDKHHHPETKVKEGVQDLFLRTRQAFLKFNEDHLYAKTIEDNRLTLIKKRKLIEQVLEMLETTRLNLRDYIDFYHWQRVWLSSSPKAQKLIQALTKIDHPNWQAAFSSWYMHHTLERNYQEAFLTREESLWSYEQEAGRLLPNMRIYLEQSWRSRQEQFLKQFKRAQRDTYQRILGKTPQELVQQPVSYLLDRGLTLISYYFPMLFAEASIVDRFFPKKEQLFDQVIYLQWGNEQAISEEGQLQKLAPRLVWFHHGQLQHEEQELLVHLQPNQTTFWGDLNRLHLGQQKLELLPAAGYSSAFHLHKLSGYFDPQTGLNQAESDAIIHHLNRIEYTPQRTLPKAGILTLSKQQRNSLNLQLSRLSYGQNEPAEKIRQLQRNGLSVYTGTEIFGANFDILLVSTTFLEEGLHQVAHSEVYPSARELGQVLHWLRHRTNTEIHLFTSLPKIIFPEKEAPRFGLEAWIEWLSNLHNQPLDQESTRYHSAHYQTEFMEEMAQQMAQRLTPYLESTSLEMGVSYYGLFFPLFVHSEELWMPHVAIVPDLFLSPTYSSSFLWEAKVRHWLQEKGIVILSTLSAHWWKNPEQEAKRLAGAVWRIRKDWAAQQQAHELE